MLKEGFVAWHRETPRRIPGGQQICHLSLSLSVILCRTCCYRLTDGRPSWRRGREDQAKKRNDGRDRDTDRVMYGMHGGNAAQIGLLLRCTALHRLQGGTSPVSFTDQQRLTAATSPYQPLPALPSLPLAP